MADSSAATRRNNPDDERNTAEVNETVLQLYHSTDPDLSWIIDAEGADALSTCDHSDHEHAQQSSTSESLDDMDLLGNDVDVAVTVVANTTTPRTPTTPNTVNATQPQRSVSIPKLLQEPEPASPVNATSNAEVVASVVRVPVKTASVQQSPASPSRTARQPQQKQRLMKINGDDTILNLYAATVAKAVSPPPSLTKKQSSHGIIAPVVTSPTNKPRAVFPRSSLSIRPEISSPTKKENKPITSGTTTTNQTMGNAFLSPTGKSGGTTNTPKSALVPIISSSSSSPSPLTKARSMATGNAKMPTRIQLEVSDHDEDEDDAMLESFDKKIDQMKGTPIGNSTNTKTGNVNMGRSHAQPTTGPYNSTASVSLLDASAESQQQHQQYLQLEIAKELDGGNNSRRFQLAIQSHVSSLTLETFTDQDMNGDDLSVSGATFSGNYSLTPGYSCDDDETFLSHHHQPLPPPPALASDESVEVSLEDGTVASETKHMNAEGGITQSPEDTEKKLTPPSFLLQKSHSWMRNKLWGQQPLEQPENDSTNNESSMPDMQDVVDGAIGNTDNPEPSPDASLSSQSLPTQNGSSPKELLETKSKEDMIWSKHIAFYCLFYIIPFTYQAGTNLPQIYFLIELVDVYDTKLHQVGIYLCISLLLRYTMQFFSVQTPRIAAVTGAGAAFIGYVILFLIEKIDRNQLSEESNITNEVLFIFGNVLIGSNEMISCVNTMAQDDPRISSTLLVRGWDRRFNIMNLSTVIMYATGGVIYQYWDITGISVIGIILVGIQLISLLLVLKMEPICPTKQTISQECQKLNFFQPDFGDIDMSNSSPQSNFKNRKDEGNISFRSIITPELATIEESPVAESDSEDDPTIKISYFDAERSEQLQLKRQSVVSNNSSGTPEFDNRTSIREMNAALSRHISEQYPFDFYETMINNHVPPLQWADIFVTVGVTVQPILKGLVFGVGTLLLFQELDQDKSTIGYVYAAASLCGFSANAIPKSLLHNVYLDRYNMYGSIYLFGTTYMILLTAISFVSTYIAGVLLMSFSLGLFVRSMNEVQQQLIHSNSKNYEKTIPHRKWIRFVSSLVITLLSPILYDVLPRLPNMVGSGVCFTFTVFVWFGSEAASKNTIADSDKSKVNTTADTIPSEAIHDSMKQEDLAMSEEESATTLLVHRIHLESLLERSI